MIVISIGYWWETVDMLSLKLIAVATINAETVMISVMISVIIVMYNY